MRGIGTMSVLHAADGAIATALCCIAPKYAAERRPDISLPATGLP
jgi:hypothetical protein